MTDSVVLDLGRAFEAVASTPIDKVDLDPEPCHGPLLEDNLSLPFVRFKEVSEHTNITPHLLAGLRVAERVAGLEVESRHNLRIGDAIFAQEAKEMMLEVKLTLFERKKKQQSACGSR